jgi:translocation and assembly module TamA
MIQLVLIGLFIGVYPLSGMAKDEPVKLCRTFVLSHRLKVELSDVEKKLVCGDTESSEVSNEGWRTIPRPQARFLLKNFLQDRGYLHPKFSQSADDHVNYVDLGEVTRVTRLSVHGGPELLAIQRKRKIVGEPLTPAILEVIQKWVIHRLQTFGYACPKVTTAANPLTGEIEVYVNAGEVQNTVKIEEDPRVPSLAPGVLRRYDAFRLGFPYNADLFSITENRIMGISLVQDIHFTAKCESDGVHVTQGIVAGKPSFLSVGAGINTEGLLIGKASWRNSRLGSYASWTDVTLMASAQIQRLGATIDWYFLPYPSRYFFRPSLELKHQRETAFETGIIRAQFAPTTTWDNQWLGATLLVGPTLDLLRTFRGDGPTDSHFLSLEVRLDVKTHDFEFYQTNPQSGFAATLIGDISDVNVFSQVSVQRFRLQSEGLWNLNSYDPPFLILGFRMGAATALTDDRPGLNTLLPPNYLDYLGGSADLRGFSRKELPVGGLGALTSFYADFEVRLGRELPLGLEPFALIDVGILGAEPLKFDRPIYWSPGLGIRWSSSIGVFRTTLAHGFAENTPGHYQFFLSYGEEF